MDKTLVNGAAQIVRQLLDFMAQPRCTDEEFDALALLLFARQYAGNEPYRRFCQGRGATPRKVKSWRDIPAVPINGFKDLALSCEPPAACERVFMTSGTTRGDVKGRHFHPTLAVYDDSMRRNFALRFMQGTAALRMGILFPTEEEMPNSSLAHYLALAVRHFGSPRSRYFVGLQGMDSDALCETLGAAERSGEPYALLGASYSFVHLMDELQRRGLRFRLPAGSRLLDTGGYKKQSQELPLDEFYASISAAFGVPRERCINMYGMTELSTQFYDSGNAVVPSVKSGPHWIRSRLVDPATGREVATGERGILVHCDLANFNSVTTILTEDVGVAAPLDSVRADPFDRLRTGTFDRLRTGTFDRLRTGSVEAGDPSTSSGRTEKFLLLGRAEGAQAKGCSLAVEEFMQAASA